MKMQRRVEMQRNVSERVMNPTFTVSLTPSLFTDHNGGHLKTFVMYYEFFSVILSRNQQGRNSFRGVLGIAPKPREIKSTVILGDEMVLVPSPLSNLNSSLLTN